MEIDIFQVLTDSPLLLGFFVLGIGYMIGNIRIAGVRMGPVIGVLLVGLVFGHFGFGLGANTANFGFALFIFSVGLQAGPTFFSAFAADGARYVMLAFVVAMTGVCLAYTISRVIDLDYGLGAGLLAGALTSTPTLAGAQDALNSGLANLPGGISQASALENINVGYAITYLFGTFGLIIAVAFFPRLAGIDLPSEAAKLETERGLRLGRRRARIGSLPLVRAYRVKEKDDGQTLAQVIVDRGSIPGKVFKVKRGNDLLEVTAELELRQGDVVSLIAGIDAHERAQREGAIEVLDPELLEYEVITQEIIVSNPKVAHRTISDLDLPNRYGCFAVGLIRSAIELPLEADTPIEQGDRLIVVGEQGNLHQLSDELGFVEQDLEKTDLATFAFGMVAGIMLGLVSVTFGDLSFSLGMAGGLLIVGIIIGYAGSVMPTFGRVPAAARYIIMELGLVMFMAAVGLSAGGGIVEALTSVGPKIILGGIIVTFAPAAVGYLFGRRVLGLNPVLLLGSITGAMTSTPALNVVTDAARSGVPALGYAGTYTFANVLLTFAGALLMIIL